MGIQSENQVIDGQELWMAAKVMLPIEVLTPPRDGKYFRPTYEWLTTKFNKWLNENQPRGYQLESFDCDDFAQWAVHAASLALNQNLEANNYGHTVLYCTFELKPEVSINNIRGPALHACNLVYTFDREWVLLEPQNGLTTKIDSDVLSRIVTFPTVFL